MIARRARELHAGALLVSDQLGDFIDAQLLTEDLEPIRRPGCAIGREGPQAVKAGVDVEEAAKLLGHSVTCVAPMQSSSVLNALGRFPRASV